MKQSTSFAVLCANPGMDRALHLPAPLCAGGMNRVRAAEDFQGSKGANVALALRALGADAVDYYAFGGGELAERAKAILEAAGIRQHLTPAACGIRLNLKVTDPAGTVTELNARGGPVTAAECQALLGAFAGTANDTVVISGSMPEGMDGNAYAGCVRAARAAGKFTAVDCDGAPMTAALRETPDLIKPNHAELARVMGYDDDTLSLCRVFRARYPGVTLLCTDGADGSYCFGGEGAFRVSAPRVSVYSTVAAGDTYLAAFLWSYRAERRPLTEALRFAAAAACVKVTLPGRRFPTPAEIAAAPAVTVTEL